MSVAKPVSKRPTMEAVKTLSPAFLLLFANVAMYAICYQAQQPAMPQMIKSMGKTEDFASYKSFFWALQFVGSLLAGYLVDTFGSISVLGLSFLSSAISYGITAYAYQVSSLQMAYMALLPTALQHAVIASRAYVTRSTPADGPQRAAMIGYVGVAYGVGMVIGPVTGGYLSSFGLDKASWAATGGSVASLLSLALLPKPALPDDIDKEKKGGSDGKPSLATLKQAIASRTLFPLLLAKAVAILAATVFQTAVQYPDIAQGRFAFDVQAMGLLLSWVGGVGTLASLFLVKPLTERYEGRDGQLTIITGACLVLLFAAFAAARTQQHVFLLAVPMVAVSTVFQTANSAALTRAVPAELQGTVIATDMALGSLARAVAPQLIPVLLAQYGFASIGYVSAGCMATMVLLLLTGTIAIDQNEQK